jgi:hypothetical protein
LGRTRLQNLKERSKRRQLPGGSRGSRCHRVSQLLLTGFTVETLVVLRLERQTLTGGTEDRSGGRGP